MFEAERRAIAARLNDEFRCASGGALVLTAGIAALPEPTKIAILDAVKRFEYLDPEGEHQVGTVTVEDHEAVWYIIYYRRDQDDEVDVDPADPDSTARLLVIMLAGEP